MSTYYIYTLSHPVTKEPFYVGRTKDYIERMFTHINEIGRVDLRAYRYIPIVYLYASILNITPKMEILEVIESGSLRDAENAETYWIGQMKQWGFLILNTTKIYNSPNTSRPFKERILRQIGVEIIDGELVIKSHNNAA
jgi:hypothetical protein